MRFWLETIQFNIYILKKDVSVSDVDDPKPRLVFEFIIKE